jgi:hypothetical protein
MEKDYAAEFVELYIPAESRELALATLRSICEIYTERGRMLEQRTARTATGTLDGVRCYTVRFRTTDRSHLPPSKVDVVAHNTVEAVTRACMMLDETGVREWALVDVVVA